MIGLLDLLIVASGAVSLISVGAVAFWPAFRRRRRRPPAMALSDPRRAGGPPA